MGVPSNFPKLQPLVNATIQALKNLGGSASNQEILDVVIRDLQLPDQIVEVPHKNGGITFLEYRLHWARTYLKKVNALENTARGVWALTPVGRSMPAEELNNVVKVVRTRDYESRKTVKAQTPEDVEEIIDDLDWKERLLIILGKMKSDGFERLCRRILRESGFVKVDVTGGSGDGGIDGHGVLRMKLVSFKVLFQAKRWQSSVGASVVRDFRGAMVGRADKGLIITTSTFTKDARAEATRDGAPTIDLVDGEDLCQLLKDTKIGIEVKLVEEVHIDESVFETI
jgi:restriction system protein